MNKFVGRLGPALVISLSLLPLFYWWPHSNFTSPAVVWRSLGQAAALIGFCLYSFNVILSSRLKLIDSFFWGINRAYIFHHLMGIFALVLLLFHPLGIAISYLFISVKAAADLLLPGLGNIPVFLGTVALWLTIFLLVLTLYVKLEYDFWKKTHRFMALALMFAFLHVLLVPSTSNVSLPLKIHLLSLSAVAIALSVLRLCFKRQFSNQHSWRVKSSTRLSSDLLELVLTSGMSKPLKYLSGQFIFITPLSSGIPSESHPFSLTSPIGSSEISVVAKIVGGFTKSLLLLSAGDEVLIEGPFGRFSPGFYKNDQQLWIAGGIGVTPFISMARSLKEGSQEKITLYYLVRDIHEAVFTEELRKISDVHKNFRVMLHDSSTAGRLTIDNISATMAGLSQHEIFICGPTALMSAFKSQLQHHHVPASKIHTEEFALN